jgi:hypothetical protein
MNVAQSATGMHVAFSNQILPVLGSWCHHFSVERWKVLPFNPIIMVAKSSSLRGCYIQDGVRQAVDEHY